MVAVAPLGMTPGEGVAAIGKREAYRTSTGPLYCGTSCGGHILCLRLWAWGGAKVPMRTRRATRPHARSFPRGAAEWIRVALARSCVVTMSCSSTCVEHGVCVAQSPQRNERRSGPRSLSGAFPCRPGAAHLHVQARTRQCYRFHLRLADLGMMLVDAWCDADSDWPVHAGFASDRSVIGLSVPHEDSGRYCSNSRSHVRLLHFRPRLAIV